MARHRFTLGQQVWWDGTLVTKTWTEDRRTVWVRGYPYTPQKAIIVQKRTLYDYSLKTITESDDYFGMSSHTYTEARPVPGSGRVAWLVAYGLHNKPVLVLDEHLAE